MDQTTADSLIAPVQAAADAALEQANGVSDTNLRPQMVEATKMLQRAIDDWKNYQLQEVMAGTREEDRWTGYGQELLTEAQRFVRDNGDFYAQYSNALNDAGDAAQDIESWISKALADAEGEYNNLSQEILGFNQQQQAAEALAEKLKPVESDLSAEEKDLLYGQTAQDASDYLARGNQLLQMLRTMLDAADAGAKFIFQNNDIVQSGSTPPPPSSTDTSENQSVDPNADQSTDQSTDDSQDQSVSSSGLGAIPALVMGMGILAVIAAITAVIVWLHGYYGHLAEIAHNADLDKLIAVAKDPTLTPDVKKQLLQDMDDANKKNPPDPKGGGGGDNSPMGLVKKALPYVAVAGAGVIVLGLFTDALKEFTNGLRDILGLKRKRNPRKRRRRRTA